MMKIKKIDKILEMKFMKAWNFRKKLRSNMKKLELIMKIGFQLMQIKVRKLFINKLLKKFIN